LRGKPFPDPEGDVGLARAAGHDELAALGGLKALHHGIDSFALMLSRLRTRLALRLRQGVKVRRVLQRRLFEVGQQEADDGLFLRVADLPGIGANAVGGGDQQAVRDSRAVRFAEEFVDIMLGDVVVG
jgi:hypothetical protein